MPVASIVIYALFLAFITVGKRTPEKGMINEDYLSLESTKALQGIACVCVILHHISQKNVFQDNGEIGIFPLIGFLFVGLFFVLSGYGLYKSLESKPDYLEGFFKKRILPIIIAFYVMNVIFAVWKLITKIYIPQSTSEWICKFIGISLMNTQSWYAIVIVIFYLSFSFAYRKFTNRNIALLFIFAVTVIQIALFMFFRHYAWWSGVTPKDFGTCSWWQRPCSLPFSGEWWVNSSIMFPLGLLLGQNEKAVTEWFKKAYWIKISVLFILMALTMASGIAAMWHWGYWREFGGDNSVTPKLITFIFQTFQVIFFCAFVIFIRMKFYNVNAATKFFSGITLEFYLMQEIPLLSFEFLLKDVDMNALAGRSMLLLYAVIVFAVTLILALGFKKVNALIYSPFKAKK